MLHSRKALFALVCDAQRDSTAARSLMSQGSQRIISEGSQPLLSLKRKRPPLLKITHDISTHSLVDCTTPATPLLSAQSVSLSGSPRDTADEIFMEVTAGLRV